MFIKSRKRASEHLCWPRLSVSIERARPAAARFSADAPVQIPTYHGLSRVSVLAPKLLAGNWWNKSLHSSRLNWDLSKGQAQRLLHLSQGRSYWNSRACVWFEMRWLASSRGVKTIVMANACTSLFYLFHAPDGWLELFIITTERVRVEGVGCKRVFKALR